jgi:hypothetical protein
MTSRIKRSTAVCCWAFVTLMVASPSFAQEVSEEEIANYEEIKEAAKEGKIDQAVRKIKPGPTRAYSVTNSCHSIVTRNWKTDWCSKT